MANHAEPCSNMQMLRVRGKSPCSEGVSDRRFRLRGIAKVVGVARCIHSNVSLLG